MKRCQGYLRFRDGVRPPDAASPGSSPADNRRILSRLRKRPASLQRQPQEQAKVLSVENKVAFGKERLPVHSRTAQSETTPGSAPGPRLEFLPPLHRGMRVLLLDATRYCRYRKHKDMISCLHTALQLFSDGRVLEDTQSADPEDLSLVLSHIHSQLAKAFIRNKKPQAALEHAHRSVQLNPSHFQNHLRQAVVHRQLEQHWLAAKSALTADWLHCCCSLPAPSPGISAQLRLYWQTMLNEAQSVDSDLSVLYTPFRGDPSPEELQRTEQSLKEQHPWVAYVYTDPRGLHILPNTTNWLSAAPGDVQRYYISLGFKFRNHGAFVKKHCSRLWPTLAEARGDRKSRQTALGTEELMNLYETILPILDLMQATQLSSGMGPGSGLMERLQFSSLLDKLCLRRERHMTLLHCQARLSTAPYLPPRPGASSGSPQRDGQLLQELQADLLDELGGRGTGTERVWDKVLQVSWLEDLIASVEKSSLQKEAKG